MTKLIYTAGLCPHQVARLERMFPPGEYGTIWCSSRSPDKLRLYCSRRDDGHDTHAAYGKSELVAVWRERRTPGNNHQDGRASIAVDLTPARNHKEATHGNN